MLIGLLAGHLPLVCVSVGSNLGDRRAHLEWAIAELTGLLQHARASSVLETDPQDVPDQQPSYLNAVVVGETSLAPDELLRVLLGLEAERGRQRPSRHAARTLDLDLILYGDDVIDRPGLAVPHPAFRERDFVLTPLVELEPDWTDPVSGKTARELRDRLRVRGKSG